MGVQVVLRSHLPSQPMDDFFFGGGGSGGGVQVLCRDLQKCTGLFCGNKEDHLPYELHVHSYDLLDFVNMLKKACTNRQKCLKLCN